MAKMLTLLNIPKYCIDGTKVGIPQGLASDNITITTNLIQRKIKAGGINRIFTKKKIATRLDFFDGFGISFLAWIRPRTYASRWSAVYNLKGTRNLLDH